MPIHPDSLLEGRIALLKVLPDLEHRLYLMGIIFFLHDDETALDGGLQYGLEWKVQSKKGVAFRQQILRGPWDQVVRRRELAHQRRIWRLRNQLWLDTWIGSDRQTALDNGRRNLEHYQELERLRWRS
jgi:hypothetical protein